MFRKQQLDQPGIAQAHGRRLVIHPATRESETGLSLHPTFSGPHSILWAGAKSRAYIKERQSDLTITWIPTATGHLLLPGSGPGPSLG